MFGPAQRVAYTVPELRQRVRMPLASGGLRARLKRESDHQNQGAVPFRVASGPKKYAVGPSRTDAMTDKENMQWAQQETTPA